MPGNTISSSGQARHINATPTDATLASEKAGSTSTSRPRAASDPLVSGRVSAGPGMNRRASLHMLRPDHALDSRAASQVGILAPAFQAASRDEAAAPLPGRPMMASHGLIAQSLRRSVAQHLQDASTALGDPQQTIPGEAAISDRGDPSGPVQWTKVFGALNKQMAELPKDLANRKLVANVSESLLAASSEAIQWTRRLPPEQSELRDEIHFDQAVALKEMAATIGAHEVVHDEKRMNALIDRFMGKEGTVFSAQTAFSELPQHALKLPNSPEGNAQTVRMLTKMAKMAVKDMGMRALMTDPTWAQTLVKDRINIILQRKEIDVQKCPDLKKAIEVLEHGTDFGAYGQDDIDRMNTADILLNQPRDP